MSVFRLRGLACSLVALAVAFPSPAKADVRLPRVFTEHAVLQRDKPIPVWGWADAGEEVTVSLDKQSATAKADADGRWRVSLKPMSAGGPYTFTVSGKNRITFKDVLVGEVWVCSGQSNMQWPMSLTHRAGQDIPKADHPRVRLLSIPNTVAGRPQADFPEASWALCTPDTARGFSAVAYYFGKELSEDLKVPIGLINSSWGGTAIEPWTPREGFAAVPALKQYVQEIDRANANNREAATRQIDRIEQWLKRGPDWVAAARKAAAANADLPAMPSLEPPVHQLASSSAPSGIYNAMIHPLVPYAIRGAIWYQGESNNGQGMHYYEKMKGLVQGWRTVWGQGDFPFYYVQVAPFRGYADGAIEGIWEAQTAALKIPNTGMAVITDVGNTNDIHPTNKHDVGHRLALLAKARTYGEKGLVDSGPIFKSATRDGSRVRIAFDHVGSGLATRDGKEPNSFQVGTAKGFVAAQAKIDGDCVVVWSDAVPDPEAVRFGWNKVANPNLMNKDGLPASPFRTDAGAFTFSKPRTFITGATVEIDAGHHPGVVRYTLDGSTPTEKSTRYEGPFKIEKTAKVTARLFGENGRTSLPASADYTRVPGVEWEGKKLLPGVRYELFEGVFSKLPDFGQLKPFLNGVSDTLSVEPAGSRGNYAMRFTGYLNIPKDGVYVFTLSSDDGSRLRIGDREVVVSDGIHPAIEKRGEKITLKAGKHPFVIEYFQGGGAAAINLLYEGPDLPKQRVPDSAILRTEG